MIGRDTKEDMEHYGPWPYLAGIVLSFFAIGVMFALAISI